MAEIQVFEEFPFRIYVDVVFAQFCDFENWKNWMPWFVSDPTAEMEVSKDKTHVKWKGRVIGEGELKRTSMIQNLSMEFEISVVHPKPINAKIELKFGRNSFGTMVGCSYYEKLPFFKWRGIEQRTKEITFDIKRGLVTVNEHLQRDGAKSTIELTGVQNREGIEYIGIERKVPFFQLQAHIKRDFERLIPYIRKKIKYPERPVPFVIYHEWNKDTYEVHITSCVELPSDNDGAPYWTVTGKTKDSRVFTVKHQGRSNITNAWRAVDYLDRMGLLDVDKSTGYAGIQLFTNSPLDIPEDDIESDFIVPLNPVNILTKKEYITI
ncbi:MAG: hypothetical protein ACJA0U_003108 [Salibacteraceae bacterium]|jgi:hypothetical protein